MRAEFIQVAAKAAVACFRNGIGTIIRENENGVKSQNVFHSRLRGGKNGFLRKFVALQGTNREEKERGEASQV